MNFDLFIFNEEQYVVAPTIAEAIQAYVDNFPKANKRSVQASINSIKKIPTFHPVICNKGE